MAVCGLMTGATVVTAETALPLPEILTGVSKLAFLGDSLTDGNNFPEFVINTLNRLYPEQAFSFVNAGVCGNAAYDLVDRLDRDILSQHPDLTFILIGTNDSGGKNPPIQFRADLLYLTQRLRAAGSKVAFISLTGSTNPDTAAKLKIYDTIIREVATEQNTLFVDAATLFANWQAEGKEMYHAPGDVHPSLEGFKGMARAILNTLGIPETVEMDVTVAPPPHLLTNWEETGPVENTTDPSAITTWTPYDYTLWIENHDWSYKLLAQRGAWFALQGAAKGRTAYARTTFDAPTEGLYELQLGGGVPLIVWVNGVKVYTLPKTNGYHPNAIRTPVLLKKGANEIIITTKFYAYVGVAACKLENKPRRKESQK